MRRVKRLKEAIARLERASVATEAQLEEEFEHGYAAGYNAACTEADRLRAQRKAVLDLHPFDAGDLDEAWCMTCADSHGNNLVWPCPTVRALLGTDTAPDES